MEIDASFANGLAQAKCGPRGIYTEEECCWTAVTLLRSKKYYPDSPIARTMMHLNAGLQEAITLVWIFSVSSERLEEALARAQFWHSEMSRAA